MLLPAPARPPGARGPPCAAPPICPAAAAAGAAGPAIALPAPSSTKQPCNRIIPTPDRHLRRPAAAQQAPQAYQAPRPAATMPHSAGPAFPERPRPGRGDLAGVGGNQVAVPAGLVPVRDLTRACLRSGRSRRAAQQQAIPGHDFAATGAGAGPTALDNAWRAARLVAGGEEGVPPWTGCKGVPRW